MSVVSNIILSFSIGENEVNRIQEVNKFDIDGSQINLVSADFQREENEYGPVWYGGTKYLEKPIYIGAYNNLNIKGFIAHLKSVKWDEPELVQLIVNGQEDDLFRIIQLM